MKLNNANCIYQLPMERTGKAPFIGLRGSRAGARAGPQLETLDLAGRGERQRIHELNPAGKLTIGKTLAGELLQFRQ